MKTFINPAKSEWDLILKRPDKDNSQILSIVEGIIRDVKDRGDEALKELNKKFENDESGVLRVSEEDIEKSGSGVSDELKNAILLAKNNIEKFHTAQKEEIKKIETSAGVVCWRRSVAIQRVGLYIPGGTAPLISTLLMLGVPAKVAGCQKIIVCSPAKNGRLHPALLYTASLLGITEIYKAGGAQAIAAMAFGTATIPKTDKVFGPGSRFVMLAKQVVNSEGIAIDMPAGPSEVAVYADKTSNPVFVAADLLSQAEHGKDSQVLLVTTSQEMSRKVLSEIDKQKLVLDRQQEVTASLENSRCVVFDEPEACFELLNSYAPEHLIIASDDADRLSESVINAGSVFLGHYSTESAGDYVSGTNHTLPTNGFAKAYSGVSLDSFVKKITFQRLSLDGLKNISGAIAQLADAEGLMAHKNAVLKRVE